MNAASFELIISEARRAERAAAGLSRLERRVLVLSAREHLRLSEIAARLTMSERQAERHFSRALAKFDRALERQDRVDAQQNIDALYRDQAGPLLRRIRARIGSSDEASDIMHEAFSRLIASRGGLPLRNPPAFLNRIVRNLLIDRRRRNAARPRLIPLTDTKVAVLPDQGQRLELQQMYRRYNETIDALPPRTREVFLLRRIDSLSYRQIAERLNISLRTVEWHIAQAKDRIRNELDTVRENRADALNVRSAQESRIH